MDSFLSVPFNGLFERKVCGNVCKNLSKIAIATPFTSLILKLKFLTQSEKRHSCHSDLIVHCDKQIDLEI